MPHQKDHHKNSRKRASNANRFWNSKFLALPILVFLMIAPLIGVTAAQFENRDSFCASCHTQPESTYFKREEAPTPVDLASFHYQKQTRCIDCHSGKGTVGRASAMLLGARDLAAFISQRYAQPAPQTSPIGDINCLKCHSDLILRQDFNNHFHFFLPRWQAIDPQAATCVDCHKSHTTDSTASTGYLNQQSTLEVCQRCHSAGNVGG